MNWLPRLRSSEKEKAVDGLIPRWIERPKKCLRGVSGCPCPGYVDRRFLRIVWQGFGQIEWTPEILKMTVTEIESAIAQLPPAELAQLMTWLQEYHVQAWDKQIEEDLEAGRLDAILAEADKEYKAGLAKPL